jgi:hypothetical protein
VRPPPVPSRSRRRRALRTPAWPAREASVKRAAAGTRPGPGPSPTAPPTMGDLAASPTSGPARPSTRAARRRGRPQGPGPVPVVRVALPPRPVRNRHRLMGTRRTRPDGRGGHQRAGHRTVDTRRPTAGSRTTNPGDWTPDGWTPDGPDTGRVGPPGPGPRNRMGGHRMLDADRRPTPWLASWHGRARRRCLPLAARWTLRWADAVWGHQPTRTAQQQGLRGHHAPRDGA